MKVSGSKSEKISKFDCINYNLRSAYRRVSKIYDEIMKPSGITTPQFFLMGEIYKAEKLSIVQLAQITDLDRTTLSRNLKILVKKNLVSMSQGENLKTKAITLTTEGRRVLLKAIPFWKKAQKQVLEKIGSDHWDEIKKILSIL